MHIGINARLLLSNRLEGIGWHAYELITRLIALNPQHQFYLFYDSKKHVIIPKGNNVHAIPLFPPSRHPVLIHAWCEYALRKALKQYRIDVFYSPEVLMPYGIRIPSIITVHDLSPVVMPYSLPWSHRKYYRYIIKRNLQLADKILTVSNFSGQEIMTICGITESKIQVIYNGVRNIFRPLSDEEKLRIRNQYTEDNPYFISIGSIHARKNTDKVIAAFETFRLKYKSTHKLILVGKFMGLSAMAKKAIETSSFTRDIICTGYIADEQLASLLGAAEASINLSEYEGFGMPIIEAMACEVPVIASDRSCFPEICGHAALLVDPYLAGDAMKTCLDTKNEMVIRGKIELSRFNWDVSAEKISSIINAMIN